MSDTAINPINIPSLQPKNQVNFQQNPSYTQPPMQGTGSEQIRQSVDNSYLANRAKASGDATPEQLLPFWLASWYGLGQLMDKFNPLCRGEYKDSILGKIGGWGDKVSTETRVGRGIENGLQWIDNKTTALAKKNKIVNALKNYSTRPEWSFAKTPGAGVHGFLATDTEQLFENFLNPLTNRQVKSPLFGIPLSAKSNYYQGLEQYGNITQQEINNFVKSLKGKTFAEKTLALQKKELELLGANADIVAKIEGKTGLKGLEKLAKSLKVKKLGFKSIREFNELKGKFLDNPDKIMKALENADKKIKFSVWRGNDNILGKIKSHLIGRIATPQEYLNKYKAILGKGNTSRLGKFLPASLGWLTEGTTSRFAGGKLAVAMQSYFLADMLYHTIKAPKGEKTKTFAERFVNDFTYFMAMTFGIKAMHKVGGLKYLGIKDKAGIEAYRKGIEAFKAKHAAGLLNNKKAYKFAQKRLDVLLGKENVK